MKATKLQLGWSRLALALVTSAALVACTSGGRVEATSGDGDDADDGVSYGGYGNNGGAPPDDGGGLWYPTSSAYGGGGNGDGTTSGYGGDNTGGGATLPEIVDPPVLDGSREVCKLINKARNTDPTPNATHTRANVLGTDLGIPVAHGSDLYFLFGDTVGYKIIWPFSESSPDAVGYAANGKTAVGNNPLLLCDGLRFLRASAASSIGPDYDASIEADFAAVAMYAPNGQSLSEYIKNPAGPIGQNMFPALPGTWEVPSGAFSHGGSIYTFYTTVQSPNAVKMKASYLAKWITPSKTGTPNYDILHRVDDRFTSSSGALGGNFINVAAEPHGSYLYMFGTGDFRLSPVHLARKPLASIEDEGGYEVYDPASNAWLAAPGTNAAPIIPEAKFGETSFRYFAEKDVWMFLAQGKNRIVARFAKQPEGPWTDEITLLDNEDPAFLSQYCCMPEGTCNGERLFNCSKASFYGVFLLPDIVVDATGFTVSYTMSTWDPYNVALFSTRFEDP